MAYTYVPDQKPSLGVLGDNALLIAIALSAVVSMILGGQFVEPRAAFVGTGALLALTAAGYAAARGSFISRLILSAVLVGFVTLHIHLSHGMVEMHFGVFATLALLLVYRDWRPIAFAAALFVAAQLGMERLQAAGWGVWALDHPGFGRAVLHVVFIVAQSGAEIVLARSMGALAAEGDELAKLVAKVDRGDVIALDVGGIATRTHAGRALHTTIAKMEAAVAVLRGGAGRIHGACSEILAGNQDLSQRTEQTAVNLQRTTSGMVDLTETARRSDDHAGQAAVLAQTACRVAENGGSVIAEAADTMQGISQSSARIAEIIGLIDGIAFQTNILALNAAVEAARDVRALIGDSVERVTRGADLMGRAGSTMTDIVGAVRRVNEIMVELGASSRRQAIEVSELGDVMSQMDQATQQNAAMVEQMAAAAGSLKNQADELVRAVEVFSTGPVPA